MSLLYHSPARILAQLMVDLSLCTYSAAWPVTWGNMPDPPDEAVSILDTVGRTQGRNNETREMVDWQGVQIKVRSLDQGYQKAKAISHALDTQVMGTQVTVTDGTTHVYEISGVSRSHDAIDLGPDPVSRRREFSINATLEVHLVS